MDEEGWITVKRRRGRVWGPCKLVVDGANVLKHGGGAAQLSKCISLASTLTLTLTTFPSDPLTL